MNKTLGLLGMKMGMTRFFDEDGTAMPVTIVYVGGNVPVQRKSKDKEGVDALQVGFLPKKKKRLKSHSAGHFEKHKAPYCRELREFQISTDDELPKGKFGAEIFKAGQFVDVQGVSKGKGFQGVMKRYRFHGQGASHGSMMHRRPGAIGAGSTPGRVWKGQKMPGHMGNKRRSILSLEILEAREKEQLLFIRGSVPGTRGSILRIRPAIRLSKKKRELQAEKLAKVEEK